MSTPSSPPEEPVKHCPACETRMPIAAAVCGICGHVFGAAHDASDVVAVPAQPQVAEPEAGRDFEPAGAAPAPQAERVRPVLPKFTAMSGSSAVPGRSVWLIGLVSAALVLLLSLVISMVKPQLDAQAAPPTVAPPTVAPPTVAPPTVAPPTAQPGRVIGAVPSVALRSGPGTQFTVLRQLPPGQSVVLQCQVRGSVPAAFAPGASDKWARVKVDGVDGFVYSALLETSGTLPECGPAK